MSDREFDNYLTLLASLLRHDGRQRKQIAAELRAHLEDRLDELIAQDLPHDEAVQRALAEFGDAAGLAASFANISRGRKRRWLMRVTSFSIAATLLLAAGIFTFWPGRNAGPGAATVVAQAIEPAPAAVPADSAPPKPKDNRETEINEVLNRRLDIDYQDTPLKDVAARLTDETGVTFYLFAKKLEEAGVSPDSPLNSHFRNIRLSTWLDLVLEEFELTYLVRDDVIVITTPEDAESKLEVRVYDCRDLLAMPAPVGADKLLPPRPARLTRAMGGMGGGMFAVEDQPARSAGAGSESGGSKAGGHAVPAAEAGGLGGSGLGYSDEASGPRTEHDLRADNLKEIITANIDPQSWDKVGGPGSVSEYNGLLVVTQTAQTHKKVEHVLDMLRDAAGLPGPGKVVR